MDTDRYGYGYGVDIYPAGRVRGSYYSYPTRPVDIPNRNMNLPTYIITCSPPVMNLPTHDTVKHLLVQAPHHKHEKHKLT